MPDIQKDSVTAAAYSKAQLMTSQRYAAQRDLLAALLEENKTYTQDQVETLVNSYLKGEVR